MSSDTNRTLVVEITLDNLLEWKPSRAAVVWSDGTRSQAMIDEAGTTRPGVFHAGQVIRLVLRLGKDGPAAPPEKVLLDGGSMSVALGANP